MSGLSSKLRRCVDRVDDRVLEVRDNARDLPVRVAEMHEEKEGLAVHLSKPEDVRVATSSERVPVTRSGTKATRMRVEGSTSKLTICARKMGGRPMRPRKLKLLTRSLDRGAGKQRAHKRGKVHPRVARAPAADDDGHHGEASQAEQPEEFRDVLVEATRHILGVEADRVDELLEGVLRASGHSARRSAGLSRSRWLRG